MNGEQEYFTGRFFDILTEGIDISGEQMTKMFLFGGEDHDGWNFSPQHWEEHYPVFQSLTGLGVGR